MKLNDSSHFDHESVGQVNVYKLSNRLLVVISSVIHRQLHTDAPKIHVKRHRIHHH